MPMRKPHLRPRPPAWCLRSIALSPPFFVEYATLTDVTLGAAMTFANSLRQADIFYELTPSQLELIAALCQERRCKAGDMIFEENAASDELYIIAQGEVDIQVDPGLVGGDDVKSP